MNNAALARHLESELLTDRRAESAPQATRPTPDTPPAPAPCPRGPATPDTRSAPRARGPVPGAQSAPQPAYRPSHVITPPPTAAPRGVLQRLWLRLFGPGAVDPRTAATDFGVFRALYEIGADHLPSSGTWPAP